MLDRVLQQLEVVEDVIAGDSTGTPTARPVPIIARGEGNAFVAG
jgi:hypothetical protein